MNTKSFVNYSYVSFFILIASIISFNIKAGQADQDPVKDDLYLTSADFPPKTFEVAIPIDGVRMTGFILVANGKGPHPTVVLLHGLPGNEKNLDVAQSLRRTGFNVLFFHYRGSWGSEGSYSFTGLHEDVLAAFDFLRNNHQKYRVDKNKLSVTGHSFGGYAALRAGSVDTNLSCVVAISAANPALYANNERIDVNSDNSIAGYVDSLFMLNNYSGKEAVADLINHQEAMDTRTYGEKLKGKNVFMIVGDNDAVTPPSMQQGVMDAYNKVEGLNAESKVIKGDHVFSISRIWLQKEIVGWMQKNCMK